MSGGAVSAMAMRLVAQPTRGEWALAVIMALSVSLAYAFPQILYFLDGNRHALILQMDEVPYVARVREVMDGHWRVADQYVWEHKGNPPVLPYATELLLGAAARLVGAGIDHMLIGVRFLGPAIVAALLLGVLRRLTGSMGWAVAGTALILLEPGTYFVKPFAYLTKLLLDRPGSDEMVLFYARFHNPLVLMVPFLLALAALWRALETVRRRDIVLAGVALGLNFYSQVFYWAYLYAGIVLLALVRFRDGERRNALVAIGALGLLVGSVAIAEQFVASTTTPRAELLPRIGVMLRIREPFNLFPKAVLAAAALFAGLVPRRDPRYAFLLCFMVGGYLLLNQNVVTGRDIQNYHFNYANAVLTVSALVVLLQVGLAGAERRLRTVPWGAVRRVGLAALLLWLVGNALGLQARTYAEHAHAVSISEGAYPSNLKRQFPRTLEWIAAHTATDSVFLAGPVLSFLIPVYTPGNVFLDPLQEDHGVTMMSEDELFERSVVYMKLQGLGRDEVFARVRYHGPMAIPGWPYGRNRALRERYDISGARAFSEILRSDGLARDYAEEFARFAGDQVLPALARYRLDYVIVTEDDPRFRRHVLDYLGRWQLTRVAVIAGERVEVYRVDGRGARR